MILVSESPNVLSTYVTGRAGVFIDESNLFHSQKTLKWRIDYRKLYWLLRDLELEIRNIFVYASYLKQSTKQMEFIDRLVEYGYFVHPKVVKEIKTQSGEIVRKGNLDIELAIDAFQFAHMYDTLILFSGDSDFEYLIMLLQDMGKKVVVISSRKNVSRELMLGSDRFININLLRPYIESDEPYKLKTTRRGVVLDGTTSISLANPK